MHEEHHPSCFIHTSFRHPSCAVYPACLLHPPPGQGLAAKYDAAVPGDSRAIALVEDLYHGLDLSAELAVLELGLAPDPADRPTAAVLGAALETLCEAYRARVPVRAPATPARKTARAAAPTAAEKSGLLDFAERQDALKVR